MTTDGFIDPLTVELNSKSYSNICKRLGAQLEEKHGVHLTHTQLRTALAAALGFDPHNRLDALLREKDAREKQARDEPPRAGSSMQAPDSEEARLARMADLKGRLQDRIIESPAHLAVDLGAFVVELLTLEYPAQLTPRDKQLILETYPDATDALMAERSMATPGIYTLFTILAQAGHIGLDYFAASNVRRYLAQDDNTEVIAKNYGRKLDRAFDEAVKAGLSSFGASATMAITAAHRGAAHDLHWSALLRILVELVDITLDEGGRPSAESVKRHEEEVIRMLMAQMGISKAAAKRYVATAKQRRQALDEDDED